MNLERLHCRTIAVELDANGRQSVVRGVGIYEQYPASGSVLRILVSDPAGDFELILDENRWHGLILEGHHPGCDHSISLRADGLCLRR
jgi:hypothetical protein